MTETLEEKVARLEAEVHRLSDIEEIRMLRMRYHELNNEKRSPEIPALFTDDAEFDFGFMGKAKGTAFFVGSSSRVEFFKQLIHNHQVFVSGDTATGNSYQDARAVFHGRAFVISGRYDDEYRRTREGWRIRRMVFDPFIMMPAERSWANPADRQVDPHAGFIVRDAAGNPLPVGASTQEEMKRMSQTLYTAAAASSGGRKGSVASSDGRLELELSMPASMGGDDGPGTNPEQLFAAGYSACFHSAAKAVARGKKLEVGDSKITVQVSILKEDAGTFKLAAAIMGSFPGLEKDAALELLHDAHEMCPYSRAVRGNIDVTLALAV